VVAAGSFFWQLAMSSSPWESSEIHLHLCPAVLVLVLVLVLCWFIFCCQDLSASGAFLPFPARSVRESASA
jgi:hypothetical protein